VFFPYYDENPRIRRPYVTIALIAATAAVWVIVQGAGSEFALARSVCEHGMIPGELTGRAAGAVVELRGGAACVIGSAPQWQTVVFTMFLHAGWFHLLGNLWFLWLFGDNVEDALGHAGFLVFYLGCGIAAALAQLAVDPASTLPMVGASGAISGVMGAYVVFYPAAPVRVVVVLVVFLFRIRVPALGMLAYWFALQLLDALPQVGGATSGVALWAHVGGFAAGVAIAALVRSARGSAARAGP
jgi:membrane associated rhomboid family serine protease